jgi:hypothetical protein
VQLLLDFENKGISSFFISLLHGGRSRRAQRLKSVKKIDWEFVRDEPWILGG